MGERKDGAAGRMEKGDYAVIGGTDVTPAGRADGLLTVRLSFLMRVLTLHNPQPTA